MDSMIDFRVCSKHPTPTNRVTWKVTKLPDLLSHGLYAQYHTHLQDLPSLKSTLDRSSSLQLGAKFLELENCICSNFPVTPGWFQARFCWFFMILGRLHKM